MNYVLAQSLKEYKRWAKNTEADTKTHIHVSHYRQLKKFDVTRDKLIEHYNWWWYAPDALKNEVRCIKQLQVIASRQRDGNYQETFLGDRLYPTETHVAVLAGAGLDQADSQQNG